ncbi:MAG TPA: preprotein translocase subunit SecG [Salinisphaeraceae bacterium]|nr:preprotein translocase subunit SecG [Salinisphaeraceae bacterium]
MIYTILIFVQVITALVLIGLILVQHGKGADAGAAFGSGASGTVFGAQGSANFLSHATAALATLFIIVSLALAYLVGGQPATGSDSVIDQLEQPATMMQMPQEGDITADEAKSADENKGATAENQPAAGESSTADKEEKDQGVTAEIPD